MKVYIARAEVVAYFVVRDGDEVEEVAESAIEGEARTFTVRTPTLEEANPLAPVEGGWTLSDLVWGAGRDLTLGDALGREVRR